MTTRTYEQIETELLKHQAETVATFKKAMDTFVKAVEELEIPNNRLGSDGLNLLHRVRSNVTIQAQEVNQLATQLDMQINPPTAEEVARRADPTTHGRP